MKDVRWLVASALLPSIAFADVAPTGKYDLNGNGLIDPGREAEIYALHRTQPVLAKYDGIDGNPPDGMLDATEAARIVSDAPNQNIGLYASTLDRARTDGGIAIAAANQPRTDTTPQRRADPCEPASQFFVRRDRLDLNAYYQGTIGTKEAKGATISFTDDDLSSFESLEAHGVVSYLLSRPCLSEGATGFFGAIRERATTAIWAQADGVRTDDPAKDKSALQFGVDLQTAWQGGYFDSQFVTLSPYFQTDFRGDAEAYGVRLAWEPYLLDANLGGFVALDDDVPLLWYWQARLAGDWLDVDDPGRTSLKADTAYGWLGGQLSATLLPAPGALDRRLKLFGGWDYYRDVVNEADARLYRLGGAWNLTQDGAISISLERKWGLERETNTQLERTLLSLNIKH